MYDERYVLLGTLELQMKFDEDLTGEGNICGSQTMFYSVDSSRDNESVRGYGVVPSWCDEGFLSDDHGLANGAGGRDDFLECLGVIRENG